MKAFLVVQDELGGEVRLPLSAVSAVNALLAADAPTTSATQSQPKPSLSSPRLANHNKYTPEFREAAVCRYVNSVCTVSELADQLRMPYQTLDKWLRDALGTTDRKFLKQAA